ncbi:MAG TPA: hypothetical protein VN578_14335 [Candidatus Binatia bacterium]|jgi:hypothetical protein|nr:hypothetical protein [Candidatus Binatia bacterium]
MNFRFTVVETSLNRVEFRWKWLRLLQHSALLGIVLCVLALVFGIAMLSGWVTSRTVGITFFALLAVAGLITWAVILIIVVAGAPERRWLAAALERVDHRFLDRLNTLLFLENRRDETRAESFALRIAKQTQGVISEKAPPSPFSAMRSLVWLLAFAVTLMATVMMYHIYSPWTQLLAAAQKAKSAPAESGKQLELAPPTSNNLEQDRNWGEVRITDPGGDLKVTKVDVVPLQIEAAANEPLNQVGWFSTVNGAEEAPHDLPPPTEPRYAVYQPLLYLDELNLSDWDVMTYYAKASTEQQNAFASEVYFVEVRPFREDILKIPGGEGGKAYQTLNDLSALISRQQHIIRQTHQHIQKPPELENLQAQDRKKLSEAESDLGESARHLYAKMATELENKPIGEALDNLAKAEQSLEGASKTLLANAIGEAQNRERNALSELVAARKMFQKAVTDNPSAFGDSDSEEKDPAPVADSAKKLNQMAEFRNEARAAQEFVRKTLEQQRTLEQQARAPQRNDYSKLATQEQQLQKSLEEFQGQHSQAFKDAESESQQAQEAMVKAAESLQQRNSEARAATQQASRQVEQLSQAMQNRAAQQQLADAYRLKQMLDQQASKLGQAAKSDSQPAEEELRRTANQARQTIDELKKAAEQDPTRDAFGQPLRDALSGQNKVDLDVKLSRLDRPRTLDQAQDGTTTQQRAAEASEALGKVSKAFDESQPKTLQSARKTDSLKPNELDSFNQGIAELDSLIKQLENNRPISPQDQAKQGHQALYNLQTGMRSHFGNNEQGNQILLHLQDVLKAETPLDVGDLKKLMDALQHFSVETSEQLAKKEDQPEMTNIDPSRLPPAYRGRIQKYFEKLSEK